jgi:penicillin-binding protein 1A
VARRRRRIVVITIIVLVAFGAFGGLLGLGLALGSSYIDRVNNQVKALEARPFSQNSIIYARNGSQLTIVPSAENRQYVPLAKISPWLGKATVAIEDRRFYQHDGVDWQGVMRAAVKNVTAGRVEEGGSTITQQLVRNLYLTRANGTFAISYSRKIKEALLALQYEKTHTKAQILEQYLNFVPYGHFAYGAEAAAETYFSVHAAQLSLAQAALLAGLPQAPSQYDPTLHPAIARGRRTEVLQAMLDQGMITKAQFAQASASGLGLKLGKRYLDSSTRFPYFVNYVRNALTNDPSFGPAAVRNGGLRVQTTIDPRMQKLAYSAMRAVLKKPPCEGNPNSSCDPASVIVSIDPHTGEILAMASTASYSQSQFNLAQGRRQAGSTFKPFTLATAIEEGIDPATTRYMSAPLDINPGTDLYRKYGPWHPRTADGTYVGPITIEAATLRSDNTVYARLAIDVDPPAIADMARRLGVNQAHLSDGPAITLGVDGVTPVEMASAYATLAAQGVYHAPHAVSSVSFASGAPPKVYPVKGKRVLQDGVAAEVTRILGENMLAGTGVGARMADGRPEAGKTGTTDEYRDAWFCGYTPDLATCVWIGYPKGEIQLLNVEGVSRVSGPTLPADIWKIFMTAALAGKPQTDFPAPKHPPVFTPFQSQFTQQANVIVPTTTSAGKTDAGGGGGAPPPASGGGASGGGASGGGGGAPPPTTG